MNTHSDDELPVPFCNDSMADLISAMAASPLLSDSGLSLIVWMVGDVGC